MHTALIPAFGRQKQVDLCVFKASLVYRVSSRTGFKITDRNPVSEYHSLKIKKKKRNMA